MRDLDIRIKLKDTLLKKYYLDSDSRVVEEMSVSGGEARADIAVINGSLHCYEIKSEFDSLIRLPSQISTYTKTFDYLTIIISEKHLPGVLCSTPSWCGIIVASYKKKHEGIKLKTYRKAQRNNLTDKLSMAQLLWKEEVINVLKEIGISKGISSRAKPFLWNLLAESLTKNDLSNFVRTQLKFRANWRSELRLFENDDCFQPYAKS